MLNNLRHTHTHATHRQARHRLVLGDRHEKLEVLRKQTDFRRAEGADRGGKKGVGEDIQELGRSVVFKIVSVFTPKCLFPQK